MIHLYDGDDDKHKRALHFILDEDLDTFSKLNMEFRSNYGYVIDPHGTTHLYAAHIRFLINTIKQELSKKRPFPKGEEKLRYRFLESLAEFLLSIEHSGKELLAVGD